jgi:putative ABC transport system permease protein
VSLLRQVARGVRALFRPGREDADVADEVSHYLEESTAAHLAQGLSPEAARRAALVEVGSAVAVREEVRTSGWEHALETALLDVRYAVRRLRKSPVFTGTAAATLALGLGASTAVFSAVRPILLEPLPFPEAHRLVTLDDRNDAGIPMPATLGTFDELRVRSRAVDPLAAADRWQPSLTGAGDPERIEGQRVTADYFEVFGGVPIVGRSLTAADDRPGAPNVVVLSDALASRRFGGARAIVGRPIDLNGDPYLVIGVMPHGFANVLSPATELWSPLRERATGDFNTREWGHHYQMVGRLTESTTIDRARDEIRAIGRAPVGEFPRPRWAALDGGLLVRPLQETIAAGARPALLAIVAAVSFLLAIAAVNVANLLLARGAQRRAEFALRLALGASRPRFLRQLLTESVVLALLGGVLGLGVAQLGVRALVAVSPPGLPRVNAIRLNAPVFGFAAALTALVGILVGLAPALGALRAGVGQGLQGGSRRATAGRGGARNALVLTEVALALVLLVSAGLLLRSVQRLMSVAPGFDPTSLVTMQVVEAGHTFDTDPARLQFFDQALEAVRRVPGVAGAAFTSQLPLSGEVDGYGYEAESRPEEKPGEDGSALRYTVTPDYFRTMGIPLRAGRLLEATDRPGAPEAIVINEHFARRLFGPLDPIGQRLRFGPQVGGGRPWGEVVGVVGDVKHYSLALEAPDAFYVANGQWDWVDNVATLVVRISGPAASVVPSLQRAVWSVNRNVPILRVQTMEGYLTASAGNRRFTLLAIETLAIAALLLAAVGLYGVISGSVTERVREIGIRTALGATPGEVVGQVVRHALTLTLAGAGIGLVGAYAASRLIASMLFGVSALDPVTYGGVIALLSAVALAAAWGPARRAVGVDPTTALRSE